MKREVSRTEQHAQDRQGRLCHNRDPQQLQGGGGTPGRGRGKAGEERFINLEVSTVDAEDNGNMSV